MNAIRQKLIDICRDGEQDMLSQTKKGAVWHTPNRSLFDSVYNIDGNLGAGTLGIGTHHGADLLGDAALATDHLAHVLGGTRSSSVVSSSPGTSVTVTASGWSTKF